MDLRIFYVCEQVITEDGVSHSGPPEPGLLKITDVDDWMVKNPRFLHSLRCRIADSLKELPWIRRFKTDNNCWGPIDFDMKYRSVSSGYELIPFNHMEPERTERFAIAEEVPLYEANSADLWIRCKIHMETPGDFIDALLGRPKRVSSASEVGEEGAPPSR